MSSEVWVWRSSGGAGFEIQPATPEQDAARAAELLADPKERAEHVMLIDLGRNDVGRVAAPGSVKVTDRMVIDYTRECYMPAAGAQSCAMPK